MASNSWFNGWVAGDIPTAAEFAKGVGAAYNTTLTGTATSIDITGLPTSYAHMLIWFLGRGDAAAASTGLNLRLNNDSGSNYDMQRLFASATTVTASETLGTTSMDLGSVPAASAAAGIFSGGLIWLPNYASTTPQKEIIVVGGYKTGTASGNLFTLIRTGFWRSTAAINRLTFLPGGNNFDVGTRATVYVWGA